MKKLGTHRIGIDQGDNVLFSDYEDGGEMWTGDGPRERRKSVDFSERFCSPPVVQCSLSMWDVDHATNVRADVSAENISDTGFDLVFRTWGNTRVARARVGWMAIGEVSNDDDWDLY
ncbi:H-type lectin domain-containing protein [Lutimaribacter sp. EGI FJ00015]|uniref:H-type lectin domain-containing protein n=1 Tax=Lutimaribacter degradans TaxID=2945989 RepID=A0ACC5ZX64_9RHOB|nr:H-type lectin domain-containing protein [Lutimaribacter sp. EGI FJ00013]MCM2562666.1 H-type lectin domain-containing protein [Lutimaribacter sp. EGI FJ00013]MCO0613823.1 H-type lectin domain-containing protein [Lutimaribacter sp. EGI FJ00015]MCO0636694.1 H-type lectin domain-containing protein [Lutimaribacter sp. EGI FJ00014]